MGWIWKSYMGSSRAMPEPVAAHMEPKIGLQMQGSRNRALLTDRGVLRAPGTHNPANIDNSDSNRYEKHAVKYGVDLELLYGFFPSSARARRCPY